MGYNGYIIDKNRIAFTNLVRFYKFGPILQNSSNTGSNVCWYRYNSMGDNCYIIDKIG